MVTNKEVVSRMGENKRMERFNDKRGNELIEQILKHGSVQLIVKRYGAGNRVKGNLSYTYLRRITYDMNYGITKS